MSFGFPNVFWLSGTNCTFCAPHPDLQPMPSDAQAPGRVICSCDAATAETLLPSPTAIQTELAIWRVININNDHQVSLLLILLINVDDDDDDDDDDAKILKLSHVVLYVLLCFHLFLAVFRWFATPEIRVQGRGLLHLMPFRLCLLHICAGWGNKHHATFREWTAKLPAILKFTTMSCNHILKHKDIVRYTIMANPYTNYNHL